MYENIKRISIIGGPGTGKTTLANNLGNELKIPVYHIDGIHYKENWVSRDKEERDKIILGKVNNEKWILDGTYRSTLEQRLEKSDLIIFLDYSTLAKANGILSRYFKYKGKEKKEIPGCKERMNMKFLKIVLFWNKEKRKNVTEILLKYKNKEILRFKNRKSLNKWYKNSFNKKIEI